MQNSDNLKAYQRSISIHLIGKTALDPQMLKEWLSKIGLTKEIELPGSDASSVIGVAAKNCYRSFEPGINANVTKVRDNWVDYFTNILKQGHGSVLEHATFTFAIEGVTRVFTAEMNRHRAGWAISEQSMRYCRFGENQPIPYWFPKSLHPTEIDTEEDRRKKQETADLLHKEFEHQYDTYQKLCEIWKDELSPENNNFHEKKTLTSIFRRILGMGVSTSGVWTGNVRALRHVLTMRCDQSAEEEICYVFTQIAEKMVQAEPLLFGDFTKDSLGYWRPRFKKV